MACDPNILLMAHNSLRLSKLEELEGKCHQLWLLNGGETGKWNGMGCDCPWVQGNLICERMKYEIGV